MTSFTNLINGFQNDGQHGHQKSWHYIPFNGGPRICIGQQFAMIEMGYTVVRIMQAFEEVRDFSNEVVLKCEITLTPGDGVKVGFIKGRRNIEMKA